MATKIGDIVIDNATRSHRFKVTANDIRNGQPNDPCNCAAARALRREFDAKEVRVYRDVTYVVTKDNKALRFATSAPLRLETVVFDRQGQFYPGEYDIYPGPIREPSKPKNRSATTGTRRNRRVGVRHSIPNVRPTASTKLPRL